jgi:hypothetical protein
MKDILKQFAKLQKSLAEEKAKVESRLAEIDQVLGSSAQVEAPVVKASPAAPVVSKVNGRRTMSAAGRARIIAAQKARWAKFNAEKGSEKGTTSKPAKKGKRTMSPEAKAKIAAAQKKRWAKFHAAKGK